MVNTNYSTIKGVDRIFNQNAIRGSRTLRTARSLRKKLVHRNSRTPGNNRLRMLRADICATCRCSRGSTGSWSE